MKRPKPIYSICITDTGKRLHDFSDRKDAMNSMKYIRQVGNIAVFKFEPKIMKGGR